STARSVSFICAARIATVEPNSPRNSESETPARRAISAKPMRSTGFSASNAMNASMTRAGADLPSLWLVCAAAGLRLDLRAMAERPKLIAWSPSMWAAGAARPAPSARQFARACGRGGNCPPHQRREPVLAHQHLERRGGGPPGGGDVLPQHRGVEG